MNYTELKKQWERRREKFLKLYRAGTSMREIAYKEGLSVQRVHQIIKGQKQASVSAK